MRISTLSSNSFSMVGSKRKYMISQNHHHIDGANTVATNSCLVHTFGWTVQCVISNKSLFNSNYNRVPPQLINDPLCIFFFHSPLWISRGHVFGGVIGGKINVTSGIQISFEGFIYLKMMTSQQIKSWWCLC